MNWVKNAIEDLYKNHKSIFIVFMLVCITILIEISSSYIKSYHDSLVRVERSTIKNQQNILSLSAIADNLSIQSDRMREKLDFDEKKYQEFDDEISMKIGVLEGRFSVIEKLFYDLNRNQLK